MPWLLVVPTEELANELEASAAALWPGAPVELRVGPAEDGALAWDGETLRWRDQAAPTASAEAAVVLARSWLREDAAPLGWIPEPAAPPPPEVALAPALPAAAARRLWVGLGLGEQLDVPGLADAVDLGAGVRVGAWTLGVALEIPMLRAPPPRLVADARRRHPVSLRSGGLGVALQAVARPWTGLEASPTWTLAPVAVLGLGLRESARLSYEAPLALPTRVHRALDAGPELGLGAQLGSDAVAVRLTVTDRAGLLAGFDQHLVVAASASLGM